MLHQTLIGQAPHPGISCRYKSWCFSTANSIWQYIDKNWVWMKQQIKVRKRRSHGLKLCATGLESCFGNTSRDPFVFRAIQNKTCSATSTQKPIKVLWCFFFGCFIPFWIGLVDGSLVSGRRSRLPNDWSVIVLVRIQIPIPSSTMDPWYLHVWY